MITFIENIGYVVHGETIGELWLGLVEAVVKNGRFELDENRGRYAVRNLRFSSSSTDAEDALIEEFGSAKNVDAMKKLVFEKDTMTDFDITPSFRNGAKSYKKRLEEGDMFNFVVSRLSKIPESKKAVMVFPAYEDYQSVMNSPWNDYLPCIVALQFRIRTLPNNKRYLDLTLFMRSWDGFQKGAGDLTVISLLGDKVRKLLEEKMNLQIDRGRLDGLVTDIHIYENTYDDAQDVLEQYLNKYRG